MLTDAAFHRSRILVVVAKHYGVTVEDIWGLRHWARLVRPRHVAAWLMRRAGNTFAAIGQEIDRDTSTVQYAVRMVEKLREDDEDFAAELVELEEVTRV